MVKLFSLGIMKFLLYNKDGTVNKVGTNTFINSYVDSQGNEISEMIIILCRKSGIQKKNVELKRFLKEKNVSCFI